MGDSFYGVYFISVFSSPTVDLEQFIGGKQWQETPICSGLFLTRTTHATSISFILHWPLASKGNNLWPLWKWKTCVVLTRMSESTDFVIFFDSGGWVQVSMRVISDSLLGQLGEIRGFYSRIWCSFCKYQPKQ